MKPQSPVSKENIFNYVFIFMTSLGLSFSLVNHFIFGKTDFTLVVIMACLFIASVASWLRKRVIK